MGRIGQRKRIRARLAIVAAIGSLSGGLEPWLRPRSTSKNEYGSGLNGFTSTRFTTPNLCNRTPLSIRCQLQVGRPPHHVHVCDGGLKLAGAFPQLRGATPNPRNGFTVLLFNGAEQHHPAQSITVTTICLSRG